MPLRGKTARTKTSDNITTSVMLLWARKVGQGVSAVLILYCPNLLRRVRRSQLPESLLTNSSYACQVSAIGANETTRKLWTRK